MPPIMLGLDLIDLAVVGGVALVSPACLGGPWRAWAMAALAVAWSCTLPAGSAGAVTLALVWPAVAAGVAVATLRRLGPVRSWTRQETVAVLCGAWAVAAASSLVVSRAGLTPFGIHEPIVQLAAVHFVYASIGALVLASAALDHAVGPTGVRLGRAGLALTVAAPPVVATGFLLDAAVPMVGGAVLMSLGVFATAALQLARATRPGSAPGARALLAVSGLAVWAPMGLAVAWSLAQHVDVPALSIADMVPTHGALNALGFVGAGLLARHLEDRTAVGVPAMPATATTATAP
jgi:hypothetical protein